MTDETPVPSALRAAAVLQLISGSVNLLLVWWMSSMVWFTVGGVVSAMVLGLCTFGLCPLPVGSLCAAAGPVIMVVAVLEIVSGVVGLVAPRNGGRVLMICVAIIELLSLLLGNPVAAVVGLVALALAGTNR